MKHATILVREWFKKDFGSLTQAEYIYIVNAIRKQLEYVIKGLLKISETD
jgi:hypothetical protein